MLDVEVGQLRKTITGLEERMNSLESKIQSLISIVGLLQKYSQQRDKQLQKYHQTYLYLQNSPQSFGCNSQEIVRQVTENLSQDLSNKIARQLESVRRDDGETCTLKELEQSLSKCKHMIQSAQNFQNKHYRLLEKEMQKLKMKMETQHESGHEYFQNFSANPGKIYFSKCSRGHLKAFKETRHRLSEKNIENLSGKHREDHSCNQKRNLSCKEELISASEREVIKSKSQNRKKALKNMKKKC